MTAPTPSRVLAAVKASGVRYELVKGWDNPATAAGGRWDPSYVVLHHTANGGAKGNAPSLGWVTTGNPYAPIRACHFLIGRDGLVYVVQARKAYHAGAGGPGRWGNGPTVARDEMNGYAYGIEIESKGTSLNPAGSDGTNGITDAQLDATARLTAALLDLIGATVPCAVNHRTWAPGRKTDTLLPDSKWHALIRAAGTPAPGPNPPNPGPTPGPTDEDPDVFIFRTHEDGKPDGDGVGNGAAYVVHNGHAVQMGRGFTYTPGIPEVRSPSEATDQAFYASVTRHKL